jgi:hypothetical protein
VVFDFAVGTGGSVWAPGAEFRGATLRLFGRIGVAAALNVRWNPRQYQLDVAPYGPRRSPS